MAALGMVEMMNRSTAMAEAPKKKNWIKKAAPRERRGVFKAKAEAAGETTEEYAAEKKHASGALGREARLAENLMGMSHKRKKKSPLYDHPRSGRD